VDKYNWVDVGSSFLPSDILAAVLWAQLEQLSEIADRRRVLWDRYRNGLGELESAGHARLPFVPTFAHHNAHAFYLVLNDEQSRTRLLSHLKSRGILAVFHYQSLHASPYFAEQHDGRPMPNADRYTSCLARLPLFHDLTDAEQTYIIQSVRDFF
jgi:dTDP-4-amino-4,6-dideoxygalactose transaminase